MLQCRRCKAFGSTVDFSDFTSQQLRDHVEIHRRQSLACFGDEVHFGDCFSSTVAKKPAASAESTRHQADFRIRSELGAIIARYASNGRVRCKICQSSLSFVFRTNAISHAMGHLNRDLFECRLCSKAYRSIKLIQAHLKKVHSANMSSINCVDRCEEHRKELIQIAEECFKTRTKESAHQATSRTVTSAKDRVKPRAEDSHNSGAHKVTSFESAKPLLVKIIKTNQKAGTIKCNECKSSLKCQIPQNVNRAPGSVLNHPMVHFGRWLFACKLCDHKTKTLAAIRQHRCEKQKPTKFRSLSGERWSQLVEFTRKCYGNRREKRIEEPRSKRPQHNVKYRNNFYFMRQRLKTEIRCNLCSRWIGFKDSGVNHFDRLSIHAFKFHLRLPLYKCLICGATRTNSKDMINHKRIRHGKIDGSTRTYVSYIREHNEEVLEALKECYGNKMVANAGNSTAAARGKTGRGSGNMDRVVQQRQMHGDGIQRYKCPICKFRTSSTTMLKRHISVVHEEVPSHGT